MTIVIYHNPRCSKSREVLALIRAAGAEPEIVEYLKTGWTLPQLQGLFAAAGVTVRDALRDKEAVAVEMGLKQADDPAILAAMVEHPELVNRPFVTTSKGTRLCRPSDLVLQLLDNPPAP